MASRPRVFTIPSSTPFLPTLIEALVGGRLVPGFAASGDPLALASATIYLPTRRACRLARDAFLDVLQNDAAILPRILPIGDIDEDEIAFADAAAGILPEESLQLPPALGNLERKLLLAHLILKWASAIRPDKGAPLVANNPATALALADDLARLMDDMTTREVPWDRLDTLVPEDMDKHWQLTLQFLKIAREAWPKLLDERGAIEPAARRDLLINAEAARLKAATGGPVIAAGSTGSMPSTAKLLATIAHLPHGAVVLPGLDTDLDDESWDLIGGKRDDAGREIVAPAYGHPQFAMHGLLRRMDILREAVETLGEPGAHGRERFVAEALRPAVSTESWQTTIADDAFDTHARHAMTDVTVIEAAHVEDEALGIATVLRETLCDEKKTAALITPDRALARRVIAALARWNVPVDDSGGDPLADNPAGIFARLVAEVVIGGLEPVPLLALFKHPLFRLGGEEFAQLPAIATLERAILRGPRPRSGSAGLLHALQTFKRERDNLHQRDPRHRLPESEIDAAIAFAERFGKAIVPLEAAGGARKPFSEFAALHGDLLRTLSANVDRDVAAFAGRDGAMLESLFADIATANASSLTLTLRDYPDAFASMIGGRIVRRPGAPGARVRIFGPLEARLQQADRVVLGGLAEGIWPPQAASDPWLSRPMRKELGLDLPERRIGLSAHDFAQALGAREIVLTRPAKREGSPTVASRFLQRLAALAGEKQWHEARARGDVYLQWARTLDQPAAAARPCKTPMPKPPIAARPNRFSVTEVEDWVRDPYSIYAKRILRIAPLDPIDTPPGARDRGSVIHGALQDFTEATAKEFPADAVALLLELGRKRFATLDDYPEARAFWWPRFQRIARWLGDFELGRRPAIAALHPEVKGHVDIPLGERTLRLQCRADRVERLTNGRYAILDYKTGQVPSDKEVKIGFSPQLTLEGAILRHGSFEGIADNAPSIEELVYVRLKGTNPPGESRRVKFEDSDPDAEADKAFTRFTEFARRFESEDYPYAPLVLSKWRKRYGDYDHLSRVKEWSATGGEIEEIP